MRVRPNTGPCRQRLRRRVDAAHFQKRRDDSGEVSLLPPLPLSPSLRRARLHGILSAMPHYGRFLDSAATHRVTFQPGLSGKHGASR